MSSASRTHTVEQTRYSPEFLPTREQDALLVVDNTFATPILQNPLSLGADLVIHSATKFLGGHADALGGVLCGRKDLVEQVFHYREINGATMDPNAAYLMIRGMNMA